VRPCSYFIPKGVDKKSEPSHATENVVWKGHVLGEQMVAAICYPLCNPIGCGEKRRVSKRGWASVLDSAWFEWLDSGASTLQLSPLLLDLAPLLLKCRTPILLALLALLRALAAQSHFDAATEDLKR